MHRVVSRAVGAVVVVVAITAAGVTPAVADAPSHRPPAQGEAASGFTAVGPSRVLDTRTSAPVGPGQALGVPVAGRGGLPTTGIAAVVLDVTIVSATAAGYLSVYPGPAPSGSSRLDVTPGQTATHPVVVPVARDGSVQVFNSAGSTQVLADVTGWFATDTDAPGDGAFTPLGPTRLLDTRNGTGAARAPIGAGLTRVLAVAGQGGVPTTGVAAVVLSVTATNATAPGYLSVFPGGTAPDVGDLDFAAGQTITDLVVVPMQDGSVTIGNGSAEPADVTADVVGFVPVVDLSVPDVGTSHYLRSLTAGQSLAQVRAAIRAVGAADGRAASAGSPQVTLLQFGAQTERAGGDGRGTGADATALGIRQTDTDVRLTYPQVVAAVQGYLDGYVAARAGRATNSLTVVVGTNSSGFDGSRYTPAAKGADWANRVVEPAVTYAKGTAPGVRVVAGDDIEPNFDAEIGEVRTWITSYLAAGPNDLVNNGAAVGCPAVLGVTGRSCLPVPVEQSSGVHTWTQADHYAISGGISPGRISLLPQVYVPSQAIQWENVDRTGGGGLELTGVLTSVRACSTPDSGCTSLTPATAWTLMSQALESSSTTASTAVPAVTDLAVS